MGTEDREAEVAFSIIYSESNFGLSTVACSGSPHNAFTFSSIIILNENVNCAHTNEHKVQHLRRPDRRTPMKVLVEKMFVFVELV